MKNVFVFSIAVTCASMSAANASSIPCKKQIEKAAIDKMESSSIVESKGSVTLQSDAIQKDKETSWIVGLMYDDPCYATVRVTLEQDSCSVKSVKIVSHECGDN